MVADLKNDLISTMDLIYGAIVAKFSSAEYESTIPSHISQAVFAADEYFCRSVERLPLEPVCSLNAWHDSGGRVVHTGDFAAFLEWRSNRIRSALVDNPFDINRCILADQINEGFRICCFAPTMLNSFRLGAQLVVAGLIEQRILYDQGNSKRDLESYLDAIGLPQSVFVHFADDAVKGIKGGDLDRFKLFWRGFVHWRSPELFHQWMTQHAMQLENYRSISSNTRRTGLRPT